MQFIGSLWRKAKTGISVTISSLEGDYFFLILAVLMAVIFLCPNVFVAYILTTYSVLYLAYMTRNLIITKQNIVFKRFVCIIGMIMGITFFLSSILVVIVVVFVLVLLSIILGVLTAIA